ncbi:hypothetical protein [Moorena sp. SIO4G3]|uniref:hypothetical protein n=1 Tax=Moorena sp. SIO4G3 TaxID=2607821 RepID=UPI00142B5EFF|nr:hypothetical protein [Moorena sp. SIO4G3]NEO78992.1 hypothetical protein [Moorena sp. SIO4G3]
MPKTKQHDRQKTQRVNVAKDETFDREAIFPNQVISTTSINSAETEGGQDGSENSRRNSELYGMTDEDFQRSKSFLENNDKTIENMEDIEKVKFSIHTTVYIDKRVEKLRQKLDELRKAPENDNRFEIRRNAPDDDERLEKIDYYDIDSNKLQKKPLKGNKNQQITQLTTILELMNIAREESNLRVLDLFESDAKFEEGDTNAVLKFINDHIIGNISEIGNLLVDNLEPSQTTSWIGAFRLPELFNIDWNSGDSSSSEGTDSARSYSRMVDGLATTEAGLSALASLRGLYRITKIVQNKEEGAFSQTESKGMRQSVVAIVKAATYYGKFFTIDSQKLGSYAAVAAGSAGKAIPYAVADAISMTTVGFNNAANLYQNYQIRGKITGNLAYKDYYKIRNSHGRVEDEITQGKYKLGEELDSVYNRLNQKWYGAAALTTMSTLQITAFILGAATGGGKVTTIIGALAESIGLTGGVGSLFHSIGKKISQNEDDNNTTEKIVERLMYLVRFTLPDNVKKAEWKTMLRKRGDESRENDHNDEEYKKRQEEFRKEVFGALQNIVGDVAMSRYAAPKGKYNGRTLEGRNKLKQELESILG